MAIFGKDDSEIREEQARLRQQETDLQKRRAELESKELDIKRQKEVLDHASELLKASQAEVAKERVELEKRNAVLVEREQALANKEMAAQSGFAEQQHAAFSEAVASIEAKYGERQKQLDAFQRQLEEESAATKKRDGEVAARELAVAEREQKADAGFAEKTRQMLVDVEAKAKANDERSEKLRMMSDELSKKNAELEKAKADLVERERLVAEAEAQRDAGFADVRARVAQEIVEQRKAAVIKIEAEQTAASKRLDELLERQKRDRLEQIGREEQAKAAEIRAEISEERKTWEEKRTAQAAEIAAERKSLDVEKGKLASREQGITAKEEELKCELTRVETLKEEVAASLDREMARIRRAEERKQELLDGREADIDGEVEKRFGIRFAALQTKVADAERENENLRETLHSQQSLLDGYKTLESLLGGQSPQEIILKMRSQTDALAALHERLTTEPTEEMRQMREDLEGRIREKDTRIADLQQQLQTSRQLAESGRELEGRVDELTDNLKIAQAKADRYEAEWQKLNADYKRKCSPEEDAASREDRIRAIKSEQRVEVEVRDANGKIVKSVDGTPVLKSIPKHMPPPTVPKLLDWPEPMLGAPVSYISTKDGSKKMKRPVDEVKWLDQILLKCKYYGVKFHPRILKAFHTSLKTAEMSPLTVLAGVSGTGKSQLPKLYSYFGRIFYESIPVQPNWDSQESMLGYFNSIDNVFDAQPLVRFLAQSQAIQTPAYPGLDKYLCMVLLDEMNLAHPELYFAEFLSKLEDRRGDGRLPALDVKIGSKVAPFQLTLGRNVLWTGTMNQDETTKSLSDKVLDRSNTLYFPRPTELIRRPHLYKLDEMREKFPTSNCPDLNWDIPFMTWNVWRDWLSDGAQEDDFGKDLIDPYKKFLETMNGHLAKAGRAIGHRVWQSVEFYINVYPDVRDARRRKDRDALAQAIHNAFEDQLVMKIMPKLRGIDTSGVTRKDCLDEIRTMLSTTGVKDAGCQKATFNLDKDFENSLTLGYGQFIWQSSNYLKDEEDVEASEIASSSVEEHTAISDRNSEDAGPAESEENHAPDAEKPGGAMAKYKTIVEEYAQQEGIPLRNLKMAQVKQCTKCGAAELRALMSWVKNS